MPRAFSTWQATIPDEPAPMMQTFFAVAIAENLYDWLSSQLQWKRRRGFENAERPGQRVPAFRLLNQSLRGRVSQVLFPGPVFFHGFLSRGLHIERVGPAFEGPAGGSEVELHFQLHAPFLSQ